MESSPHKRGVYKCEKCHPCTRVTNVTCFKHTEKFSRDNRREEYFTVECLNFHSEHQFLHFFMSGEAEYFVRWYNVVWCDGA